SLQDTLGAPGLVNMPGSRLQISHLLTAFAGQKWFFAFFAEKDGIFNLDARDWNKGAIEESDYLDAYQKSLVFLHSSEGVKALKHIVRNNSYVSLDPRPIPPLRLEEAVYEVHKAIDARDAEPWFPSFGFEKLGKGNEMYGALFGSDEGQDARIKLWNFLEQIGVPEIESQGKEDLFLSAIYRKVEAEIEKRYAAPNSRDTKMHITPENLDMISREQIQNAVDVTLERALNVKDQEREQLLVEIPAIIASRFYE
ncbi:MAG: hypothetical protein ACWGQW_26305, partial [bacterium]